MARLLSVAKIVTVKNPALAGQLKAIRQADAIRDRKEWRQRMQAQWKAMEMTGGMNKTRYGTYE